MFLIGLKLYYLKLFLSISNFNLQLHYYCHRMLKWLMYVRSLKLRFNLYPNLSANHPFNKSNILQPTWIWSMIKHRISQSLHLIPLSGVVLHCWSAAVLLALVVGVTRRARIRVGGETCWSCATGKLNYRSYYSSYDLTAWFTKPYWLCLVMETYY